MLVRHGVKVRVLRYTTRGRIQYASALAKVLLGQSDYWRPAIFQQMYNTDALRWRALQNRDSAASPYFVYAVISTKIYCRPGCPSRLARRANVYFYDTPDEARVAGYRPCLRCKPDQVRAGLGEQGAQHDAVARACRYIEETKGRVKFAEVAKHVGLSTRYLYGIFKAIMGTTPAKYAAGLSLRSELEESSGTWSADSGSGVAITIMNENAESNMNSIAWNSLLNFDFVDFSIVHGEPGLPWQDSDQQETTSILLAAHSEPVMADTDLDSRAYAQFDPFLSIVDSQKTNISHTLG